MTCVGRFDEGRKGAGISLQFSLQQLMKGKRSDMKEGVKERKKERDTSNERQFVAVRGSS